MPKYQVSFAAICKAKVEVEADSEEEAIRATKDGQYWDVVPDEMDRIHPDTEFFVTEVSD